MFIKIVDKAAYTIAINSYSTNKGVTASVTT
jgi:hypothetical protein